MSQITDEEIAELEAESEEILAEIDEEEHIASADCYLGARLVDCEQVYSAIFGAVEQGHLVIANCLATGLAKWASDALRFADKAGVYSEWWPRFAGYRDDDPYASALTAVAKRVATKKEPTQ